MSEAQIAYTLLGVVILLANAVTAWGVLTGKAQTRNIGPQPFEVKNTKEILTKDDHATLCNPLHNRVGHLESEVRAIRLKMDADKQEILASADVTALRIHERIDTMQKEIAHEIAATPAQTIALLKNTKGLL